MPHYWIAIATPDDIRRALEEGEWARAKQLIYKDQHRKGLALDEVYFDPDNRRAYVLVHTPESVDLEGVGGSLGAEALELFTVEELNGYGGQAPKSVD